MWISRKTAVRPKKEVFGSCGKKERLQHFFHKEKLGFSARRVILSTSKQIVDKKEGFDEFSHSERQS